MIKKFTCEHVISRDYKNHVRLQNLTASQKSVSEN